MTLNRPLFTPHKQHGSYTPVFMLKYHSHLNVLFAKSLFDWTIIVWFDNSALWSDVWVVNCGMFPLLWISVISDRLMLILISNLIVMDLIPGRSRDFIVFAKRRGNPAEVKNKEYRINGRKISHFCMVLHICWTTH